MADAKQMCSQNVLDEVKLGHLYESGPTCQSNKASNSHWVFNSAVRPESASWNVFPAKHWIFKTARSLKHAVMEYVHDEFKLR